MFLIFVYIKDSQKIKNNHFRHFDICLFRAIEKDIPNVILSAIFKYLINNVKKNF